MKKIVLKSVPLRHIRNNQAGDWRFRRNGAIIALSAEMSDDRSELAVAIHEAIEAFLCQREGVTDSEVTAFDHLFEEERARELHAPDAEDGDDPRAPYHFQHQIATVIEHAVAAALGLSWAEHTRNVNALFEPAGELCHGFGRQSV